MKVNRRSLVESLDKVWPAVGRNALIPKYQSFTFHGNRVQATGGALWIDTSLPEGFELSIAIEAEPFYNLLRGMSHEEVDITVQEGKLVVSAPKVNSEFFIFESDPAEVPAVNESVDLNNLEDLVRGLEFCRFGVSRDETMGALCGVKISQNALWSCDRYRVLRWNLDTPVNLACSLPVKFLELLIKMQVQIKAMEYQGDPVTGGTLNLLLQDGTVIWGCTLTGEYPDLEQYFPDMSQAETIQLDSSFPSAMDRHLTFLKDVPPVDKEVVFQIDGQVCRTHGQKTSTGKRVERVLDEETPLENARPEAETFEFLINPVLLKDVMGLCWQFKFFPGSTVVLFDTPKFSYLVQTRG